MGNSNSSIILVKGYNPGPFTLDGSNTYLVGSSKERILIGNFTRFNGITSTDTGQGIDKYKTKLLNILQKQKAIGQEIEIKIILITHGHADHVGGIPQIKSIFPDVLIYKRLGESEVPLEPNPYLHISPNQEFSVQGATLRSIYTPGHTSDHVSFLHVQENSLFSGDCILGKGSSMFECLRDYMSSLSLLESLKPNKIYPGHGPVVHKGHGKIKEYIKHRMDRESQILDVLSKSSQSSESLLLIIYKGYPSQVLEAAKHVIDQHLDKLVKENRVFLNQDDCFALIS